MRIALLAPYPVHLKNGRAPQHPASWVRALARALSNRSDIEMRLYTHLAGIKKRTCLSSESIEVIAIPKYEPRRLGSYLLHFPARYQFSKELSRFSPDVIHGFGTATPYGLIATEQKALGVVFIQGIQEYLSKYQIRFSKIHKTIRRRIERVVITRADGIIGETRFATSWANSISDKPRSVVIPHAVNEEFLCSSTDYTRKKVLFIGTLNQTKNVHFLLEAFSKVDSKDSKLCIIGSGPFRKELLSLAMKLDIIDKVSFIGHQPRDVIIREMLDSRCLALFSHMDTSPNVITEAHAVGLPIVAARVGGIPDMVTDEEDGFLITPGDTDGAADKLSMLLANPSLAKRLGKSGKDRVARTNKPSIVASAHIEFYKSIMGNSGAES